MIYFFVFTCSTSKTDGVGSAISCLPISSWRFRRRGVRGGGEGEEREWRCQAFLYSILRLKDACGRESFFSSRILQLSNIIMRVVLVCGD